MTEFLHVANGTSTTSSIQQAGLPGRTSIWADVLYDGPVPGDLTDDQLLQLRARHLASGEETLPEVVAELQGWRGVIEAQAYDELVLWYEHDLFDQLNLIQLLTWIASRDRFERDVRMICVGSFPGRPRFKGLGELTPSELASLFETRVAVDAAQYELAGRAWAAFRASDPRAIETLLASDTSALPFLARALRRYLQEFPWVNDGLSRSERRLVELASAGSLDIHDAFRLMSEDEDAYYITDGSLQQMLDDLGAGPSPLIDVDTSRFRSRQTEFAQQTLPDETLTITNIGRAVLTGNADRITLRGIDRWFGGVRLEGSQAIWRWDETRASIAFTSLR